MPSSDFDLPGGAEAFHPVSPPAPSLMGLFRVWALIGLGSFGGGASTFTLIRRAFVQQSDWLTNEEFIRYNGLCQLTPGINLLGLAILIGRRLCGGWGVPISLVGLIFPSAAVTVLMTIGYAHIRDSEAVKAALRGLIPTSIGLGLLSAAQTLLPMLKSSRIEGRVSFVFSCVILFASGMAILLWHWPVIAILLSAGLSNALVKWGLHRYATEKEEAS
jgi:chromate transporter